MHRPIVPQKILIILAQADPSIRPYPRFVAYRTSKDIDASIEYYGGQGLKEANALFNRFSSKIYNCREDTDRDLKDILSRHTDSAYVPHCEIVPVEVNKGYGHRGRPRKGEKPIIRTEYRVDVELEFDESIARRMSEDRNIRVLVTNLPGLIRTCRTLGMRRQPIWCC